MITKFNLFESKKFENKISNLPEELLNRITDDFSFIVWKGKKKNGQKNYKSIRIIDLDGTYSNSELQVNSSESTFLLKITMSNNDYIEAKYYISTNIDSVIDNNITISINQKLIYDLGDKNNDENKFLMKTRTVYMKYLEKKNWRIK
jgi:hypothetical protein